MAPNVRGLPMEQEPDSTVQVLAERLQLGLLAT